MCGLYIDRAEDSVLHEMRNDRPSRFYTNPFALLNLQCNTVACSCFVFHRASAIFPSGVNTSSIIPAESCQSKHRRICTSALTE